MSDDDTPPADPDELDFTKDERVAEIDDGRYVVSTNEGGPNVDRTEPAREDPAEETRPQDDPTREDESPFNAPTEPKDAAKRKSTSARASGRGNSGARSESDANPNRGSAATDATGANAPSNGRASGASRDTPQSGAGGSSGGGSAGSSSRGDGVDSGDVSRWLAGSFDDDGFTYGFDATLHAEGDTTRHRMVSNDVTATFDTLVSWFAMNAGREAPPAEALGLLLVAADSPVQFPVGTLKRYVAKQGLSPDDSIGDLLEAVERDGGLRIDTS